MTKNNKTRMINDISLLPHEYKQRVKELIPLSNCNGFMDNSVLYEQQFFVECHKTSYGKTNNRWQKNGLCELFYPLPPFPMEFYTGEKKNIPTSISCGRRFELGSNRTRFPHNPLYTNSHIHNKTPLVFNYLKFTKSKGKVTKNTKLHIKDPSQQYILINLNQNCHGIQTKSKKKLENHDLNRLVYCPARNVPQEMRVKLRVRRVRVQRAKVSLFKRLGKLIFNRELKGRTRANK